MYDKLNYSTGAELCAEMAKENDTVLLAFSTGKDSIAAWLQMREHFPHIIPYYCYCVPGLEFVEESLKYYEDFFGEKILRVPHRALWNWLGAGTFQPPRHIKVIEESNAPVYDDTLLGDIIRAAGNLPPAAYAGVGVRMADSPMRRISIKQHGAINHNGKMFYPVFDWRKADLLDAFRRSGVKLPIDYKLFGRTFDGLDYRFLAPIKKHFPRDWQKILEWFPLAEAEIFRREKMMNG